MADATAISDAEWQVMNVVWHDQPVEAQQVIDQLAAANNWSSATIKTMLHRLVKQVSRSSSRGKRYLYRAALGRPTASARRAALSGTVFGGAAAPALMHLVQTSTLTDDEVARLRRLLDRKASKS